MKLIHVGVMIVFLLIIRTIEMIYNLYFIFYIHDILLIVLFLSIFIYGLIYRKHHLKEMFQRIDRPIVKITNLVLLIILWLFILGFSTYGITRISSYLFSTEISDMGWALRDMLYGKSVNVTPYLIQTMPLLTYAMFYDIKGITKDK